jgi:hypothetical protein
MEIMQISYVVNEDETVEGYMFRIFNEGCAFELIIAHFQLTGTE